MTTQPDNFGFGEDETMLRDAARKFFQDNLDAAALHGIVAGDSSPLRSSEARWGRSLWQQVVELGWTAACVPERAGGVGLPLVAALALAEEAGRAAFPSPMETTFMATAVLAACNTQAADKALERIAAGAAVALAVMDHRGSLEPTDTDVTVGPDGRLEGTASFVQEAQKCDAFLVSARGAGGIGLYWVEADVCDVRPDHIIDLTRDQASVGFGDTTAEEIAPPGSGDRALDTALPAMLSILSADMVGAGEWLLQTTAEYAQTRVQFDRPIGFFQAIKHPLVNLMIEIDDTKSLAYNAACAVDVGDEEAINLARMAKSRASDMAAFSASRAVQFHGGIGFTWEAYVHLFFKRQMMSQTLLGDGRYHRTKLADALISPAA